MTGALMLPIWLTPLALALLLAVQPLRALALRLAPWAALPALAAAMLGETAVWEQLELLTGVRLGLDETGRSFLLFSALLWLIAGLYARAYLAADARRARFWAFFLAAQAGNLGLIVALDAASFYLGFALMTFAAYGLVVHAGDREALRAGRVYLVMAVLGEALLLAGLLLFVSATGGPNLPAGSALGTLPAGLLAAGFGVKAGVVLLHMWLPLAHPVAPTPASAVLSGAMIKAGLLGWLRFLPLGQVALIDLGGLLLALGVVSAFYAAAVGLAQREAKTILAYSSVSQMGFMTAGVGAGLLHPAAWPLLATAVTLYAFHHGLAKGALFLGVGVAQAASAAGRRWGLAGLALPALALAGAPLTSGFLAKDALKAGLADLPAPWPGLLAVLLPLAAVGTALLMARFVFVLAQTRADSDAQYKGLAGAWLASLVAVAAGAWLAFPEPARASGALQLAQLGSASLPLLAAGVLVAAALGRGRGRAPGARLPAGDVLVIVEGPLGALWRALVAAAGWPDRAARQAFAPGVRGSVGWVAASESALARIVVSGMLFLLMLAALIGAWMTQLAGRSLALGACAGGAVPGEARSRHQLEAECRPIRDVLLDAPAAKPDPQVDDVRGARRLLLGGFFAGESASGGAGQSLEQRRLDRRPAAPPPRPTLR
jgi:formate hydrogenlyase subunit 3/multisubunit Na+/H+ antiporter MnhD subunit